MAINNLLKKITRIEAKWINYYSKWLPLILIILLIIIPGLVGMGIWTNRTTDRMLMTTSKQTLNLVATHFARDMEERSEFNNSSDILQIVVDRWSSPTMWFWVKSSDSKVMVKSKQLSSKPIEVQTALMSIQLSPTQFRRYQMAGYHLTIGSRSLSIGSQLYMAQDVTELQLKKVVAIRNLAIATVLLLFLPIFLIARIQHRGSKLKTRDRANKLVSFDPSQLNSEIKEPNAEDIDRQRQFTNNISHELRTPLSLVYGYLQSLLRRSNNLTVSQREALQTAAAESERMVQILQNLLDRARSNQPKNYSDRSDIIENENAYPESLSYSSGSETTMTANAHILLVEDEIKLARFIELELSSEGYRVSVAHDGTNGLILARESPPDLFILDWMLPGLTGVELCRRLRTTGIKAPVILLTARDDVADRVAGLDAGADDYVLKPFSIEELLARIRAHLRRTQEVNSDLLQFEDLSLNRRTREVFRGERSIDLTVKEFDLLEYLLSHPRQVLTKDQILQKVWGYDFMGDSNIIEVYIRYLRLKLEENREKRLIHTARGVGYSLRE